MTIDIQKEQTRSVVALGGRLDTTTAPSLEKALAELTLPGASLVLDMKQLEYISSAGLRVLLTVRKKLQENFVLTNVCPDVMEVLDITGFSDILTIK